MKSPLAADVLGVDSTSSSPDTHRESCFCFSVQADADPGLMSRVIEVFALRGLVPTRCHGVRGGAAAEEFHVDLQFEGMSARDAAIVAEKLRQVWLVHNVLMSSKESVGD